MGRHPWASRPVSAAHPAPAGAGYASPQRADTERKLTVFFIFSTKLLSLTEGVLKNKSPTDERLSCNGMGSWEAGPLCHSPVTKPAVDVCLAWG